MKPKKYRNLLNNKNVVAVAKGKKWVNGKNTGEEALLVFVSKKIPKEKLKDKDLIPKTVDGHKTDVVGKSGIIKAMGVLTKKIRPIVPGYSCGHTKVTAGTLGAWFVDKDGELVGLSNNHVLANENNAKVIGEWQGYSRWRHKKGHLIVQPGTYDDRWWRRHKNGVGRLKKFVKLKKTNNKQDSAIFKPKSVLLAESEIWKIGQLNGFRDDLRVGETVQKSGRTTGHTMGKVIATDGVVAVQYGRKLGVIEFEDQIITDYLSDGGDSGSILADSNNNAVGLLFAGSAAITIHNKIKYPRDHYGLKIYNPNPLTESYVSTLIVDGVSEVITDMGDLNALVKRARDFAKTGKTVKLSISLNISK